jgi:gamma-glutamyltranspeptidase / glutathione hydrolase
MSDPPMVNLIAYGNIGMYHSGIGGGGFLLTRDKEGKYEFIDARETAPAAAYEDMYKQSTNASVIGGLARYVSLVLPL